MYLLSIRYTTFELCGELWLRATFIKIPRGDFHGSIKWYGFFGMVPYQCLVQGFTWLLITLQITKSHPFICEETVWSWSFEVQQCIDSCNIPSNCSISLFSIKHQWHVWMEPCFHGHIRNGWIEPVSLNSFENDVCCLKSKFPYFYISTFAQTGMFIISFATCWEPLTAALQLN